jgi:hypothetical protein
MPLMEIVKTPDGEAPLEVRKAWVGLTLDFEEVDALEEGVVSRMLRPARHTVLIKKATAIAALKGHNEIAYRWWMDHYHGQPAGLFSFGRDEVRLVS